MPNMPCARFTIPNLSALLLTACAWLVTGITASAQREAEISVLQSRLLQGKKDTCYVNTLYTLSLIYLQKQGELPGDLDSATLLKNQGLLLSKQLHYISGIGTGMVMEARIADEKKLPERFALYDKTAAFLTQHHQRKALADVYLSMAFSCTNEADQLQNKISLFKKALHIQQQENNRQECAFLLKNMADCYHLLEQYDTTLVLLNQSLALYQAVHYKDLQGVYTLFSELYRYKSDLSAALKYALLAAVTAEQVGDKSGQLTTIYNRVGLTYHVLFDMSLCYFHKALDVAYVNKDSAGIVLLSMNIANTLLKVNRVKEALALVQKTEQTQVTRSTDEKISLLKTAMTTWLEAGQPAKAEHYYRQLMHYYHPNNVFDTLRASLAPAIVSYLQRTGRYAATYPLLNEYIDYYRKSNRAVYLMRAEELYCKTDSALRRYQDALAHHQRFKHLSDSLFTLDKSKQLNSLQLQFETAKKDNDIQLLTQQSQLQASSLQRERLIRKFTAGGVIMLLLFLAVLYNRYRVKQRSNLQLEQKQEEINQQNELLKKLLGEKEWLLKEIHHRVKNNLQIVISLLNTQSSYLENEDARSAIRNSQHRMHAMSLIHQKLYQSNNLATIDMQWYIHELVKYMCESFSAEKKIQFTSAITPIQMDVVQAVPLGLILNEAISNCIKYAFPGSKRGEVHISLQNSGNDIYQLQISDNGIGLPESFDPENSYSLGMSLMRGLSGQLQGNFSINSHHGVTIIITFVLTSELPAAHIL
jgi:two-component sensor histidine kinase